MGISPLGRIMLHLRSFYERHEEKRKEKKRYEGNKKKDSRLRHCTVRTYDIDMLLVAYLLYRSLECGGNTTEAKQNLM